MRNGRRGALAVRLMVVIVGVLGGACSRNALTPPPDAGQGQGGAGGGADAASTPPDTGNPAAGDASDAVAATDAGDAGNGSDAIDAGGGSPPGLTAIALTPITASARLVGSGTSLSGTAQFQAIGHFIDGHTQDLTATAMWISAFPSMRIVAGLATVTAPGIYTVTVRSGNVTASSTLYASADLINVMVGSVDPAAAAAVDQGSPGFTHIVYPTAGTLVPSNLSPLQIHIERSSAAQTTARLTFTSANTTLVNVYSPCLPGPGLGCYVDVPPDVARLFVADSEGRDIYLSARVGGVNAPIAESLFAIPLAFTNVPLAGALYYWTSLRDGSVTGYRTPRFGGVPASGAGIFRYDFGREGAAQPQLVYTDQGRAPLFQGSPPATADGGQCIGCHALSGDGKTMALTIGGSGAPDIALLDLPTLTLATLDAPAAAGATGPADINYYKQFRRAGVATETTFGPNGDVMVNMYRSKLFLRGTTSSLANQGPAVPAWPEYESDPFWSASGKLLVFTSFPAPDVGTYNDTGLNGDMKRFGQIVIATATATRINDDARVLVPREDNVTKFYPAVSPDDQWVIYDQSACGLDPDVYTNLATQVGLYGSQTCDGYDDSTAALWLAPVTPGSARPVRLDVLNGGIAFNQSPYDTSRPQWAPAAGTFRGKKLYWVAFSSRRPYGLQVNQGTPLPTPAQLWVGAVLIGGNGAFDSSSPPLWLPNQNLAGVGAQPNQVPSDNHTPAWARVAVPLPQ